MKIIKAFIGLVYSVNDLAGRGIAKCLRDLTNFKELNLRNQLIAEAYYLSDFETLLTGFTKDVIYFDFLDDIMDVNYYIALSRHRSEAGIKSLTVHHTGNPWPKADFGGNPLELSIANPRVTKALLLNILGYSNEFGIRDEFSITYEVTHHGPTNLSKPLSFVEIGSSQREWLREDAQKVLALSVLDIIAKPDKLPECTVAGGFGGNHYASKFTKIAIENNICFSHIIAKYALKELDAKHLVNVSEQAIKKSSDKVTHVLIEKKIRKEWKDTVKNVALKLGTTVLIT